MSETVPEETYSSDGLVCPYCHHLHKGSWELGDGGEGDGEMECGECGKTILWSRVVMVRYKGKMI